MKTIISVIISYILLVIVGTLFFGTVIMLYQAATAFVVGTPLTLFSFRGMMNGMLVFFPVGSLFIPMFLFLMLIRHSRQSKIAGIITVAVISLLTWTFAVPASFEIAKAQNVFSEKKARRLSPGFFREIDNAVYYFTSVDSRGYASGIEIKENDVSSHVYSLEKVHLFYDKQIGNSDTKKDFADPIIGNGLEVPVMLKHSMRLLGFIEEKAFESWNQGYFSWLMFISMIAAFIAVSGLIECSVWRLVNAFYVIIVTILILVINCLAFNNIFDSLIFRLTNVFPFLERFSNYVFVALNIFFVLVLTFVGILSAGLKATSKE